MPVPRYWFAPAQEAWFHSAELEAALPEAYASGAYDLVHVDEPCLARACLELPPRPELLHHHKLDLELTRALHLAGRTSLLETMRWRTLEELVARRFVHHAFCTAHDAERFRARHPETVAHVVPNGVDLAHFQPRAVERDPDELLFLGSLDYAPNVDGLERFLAEVWPALRAARPRTSLVVVGRAPSAELRREARPGVHVIPDVDDVRPYLARAAALVVPLTIGGGSRLKIAEALAMGCPVVSTEIGAQGYAPAPDLEVVPAVADLAEALARRLAAGPPEPGARDLAALDWDRAAERLDAAWRAAAAAPA
ncbi:MAG: glycosyltransferase [Planctomycetes bacterium]|nr:glycosyltransferase [Planctomycetota bacterium]